MAQQRTEQLNVSITSAEMDDYDFGNQAEGTQQFIAFMLMDEEYGVEIGHVREIAHSVTLTKVPMVPDFVLGVFNLRGEVVPVIDLRRKFGMPIAEYGKWSGIIVVRVGERSLGVIADRVSDAISCVEEEIRPAPKFSARIRSDFIQGLFVRDGRMIVLLQIEKILSDEELADVQDVATQQHGGLGERMPIRGRV